ncbi:sodium:solute symporter family protein [Streptomyces iconiensis]|uniref:Sodium:solute symporter family protein n=1 Tax=Streptomyces iconiensis TaxID=1384038 RepID=A0ABT7A582_9ACTN|nr:sodium:solute symporter family protein [Streptomyces iconiensis]MDJ1136508.1 sodium:solute symporter family protein [Streptomyces iconiensis]
MIAAVVALVLAAAMLLALLAGRISRGGGISEFLVGGRSFPAWLIYFLAVGEVYSIGAMIGFPSGVYAEGASSAVWFMGYILLAYVLGYFIAPLVWRAGHHYDAMTIPEVFGRHFRSRGIEVVAALTMVVALIPWGQYQFIGLRTVLGAMDLRLTPLQCVVTAGVLGFLYVAVSGVRSPAFVSVLKDALMVLGVAAVGIAAVMKAGGVEEVTGAHAVPLPSVTLQGGQLTYTLTTIVFQAVVFYLAFGAAYIFPAKSEAAVKSSTVWMPLYMLMFPFLVLASYWALAEKPHLKDPNTAFIAAARALLPEWLVGFVAAGAALSGVLVLAVTALNVSGVVTRTLMRGARTDVQRRTSTLVVAGFVVVAALLTLYAAALMLTVLNLTYMLLAQLVPAWISVLWFRRTSAAGAACGMAVGVVTAIVLYVRETEFGGVNPGLVSMALNAAVLVVWTLVRPGEARGPVALLGSRVPAGDRAVPADDEAGRRPDAAVQPDAEDTAGAP